VIRLQRDTTTLFFILILLEAIAILIDLSNTYIYDWIPILLPLLWINVSIIAIYSFFRSLVEGRTPTSRGRYSRLLNPDFKNLKFLFRNKGFKALFIGIAIAYFIIYAYLQGMITLDFSGGITPRVSVLPTIFGYGPVVIIAPTNYIEIFISPYIFTAALAISILSATVISMTISTLASFERVKKVLPTPIIGFAVVCPTCVLSPATAILTSLFSIGSSIIAVSIPTYTLLFTVSTILLLLTLIMLWVSISMMSRIPVKEVI